MALPFASKSPKNRASGNAGGKTGPVPSLGPLFGKRNLRYGFVSVCITVAVIAVIVLFNVVLTTLFKRYPLDIDLTEDRIFEISGETRDFLTALDRDVDIYVLSTESAFTSGSPTEYFIQANEVIRRYSQYSSRVRLEYVDIIRNPNFPSRYPDLNLNPNDILLVCGDRARKLSPQDLFNIQSSYYGSFVASSKAEQAMTSALLIVTSTKTSLAAVINGHGEADITPLTELLRMNAWEVVTLNSMTEAVPPEAGLVILAAPDRDLSPEELDGIDTFLEGGNNRVFLYFSSYAQPGQVDGLVSLTNLDAFLTEWGVAVEPGIVFETNDARIIGASPYVSFADFTENDYSKPVAEKGLFPVLPQARPLRLVFEAERYRTTSTLIHSSASSGVRPADADAEWLPRAQDMRADIPLMTLSKSTRNNVEGDIVNAHVVVCGSVLALNQGVLGNINIGNSEFMLDLLGRLAGREDQIYVQDKTLGFSNLNITAAQVIIFALIFIVVVPLAVLGTGIVVWLRRRHR
jgi:ABC-type uncharacterized transport system involved in gliding motility auxiliary subunit